MRVREPGFENVGWTLTDMGSRPHLNQNQLGLMDQIHKRAEHFVPIAQGGEIVLQDYINLRDGHSLGQRDDKIIVTYEGGYTEREKTNWYGNTTEAELVKCRLERRSQDSLAGDVRWYYRDCSPGVIDALIENSFFSTSVADYMRHNRRLSLMAGTRLHGNIMALAQGVPTLFGIHDHRIKEMAELFESPRVDLRHPQTSFDPGDHDWGGFNRAYPRLYEGFKAFFEENGLAHNL